MRSIKKPTQQNAPTVKHRAKITINAPCKSNAPKKYGGPKSIQAHLQCPQTQCDTFKAAVFCMKYAVCAGGNHEI